MSDELQKKIFAKNLNKFLEKSGKSQREVAQAIGVIPTTFNTWCLAQSLPRMGKIQALADYFKINKSDLIEDTIDNTSNEECYLNSETKEIAQKIFYNKDLALLFEVAKDASAEDLQTTCTILLALKKKSTT